MKYLFLIMHMVCLHVGLCWIPQELRATGGSGLPSTDTENWPRVLYKNSRHALSHWATSPVPRELSGAVTHLEPQLKKGAFCKKNTTGRQQPRGKQTWPWYHSLRYPMWAAPYGCLPRLLGGLPKLDTLGKEASMAGWSLSFTTMQVEVSESSVLILAATYFSSGATRMQSMKGCSSLSSSRLNKTS